MTAKLFVPLIFSCILLSCNSREAEFCCRLPDGSTVSILLPDSRKKRDGEESQNNLLIIQENGVRKSPEFVFDEPVSLSGTEHSFTITYQGDAHPVRLHLMSPDNQELKAVILPKQVETGGTVQAEVGLDPGMQVGRFYLSSQSTAGTITITSCSVDMPSLGFSKEEDVWRLGSGIEDIMISGDGSAGPSAFAADIDKNAEHNGEKIEEYSLRIVYNFKNVTGEADRNNPVSFSITAASGSRKQTMRYFVLPGTQTIYLYPLVLGFYPEKIIVDTIPEGVEITALSFKKPSKGSFEPLPIEAGSVLDYPEETWRKPEYELFSWTRAPGIVLMDMKDYEIQSRYFKRLAFFVEKYGFAGKLLSNHTLDGRHGWNAHDYRAVDLAFFFQKARDSRFRLNEEEEHLRDLLIENGIIREEDGVYIAGRGGIISISRSSTDYLREKFLIHECCHGLFFVNEKIEEIGFTQWNKLDETEQEFWRYFLRWMSYNTEDTYLLVNEYLAYLLQQPVRQAESYFRDHPAYRFALENAPTGGLMREKTTHNQSYFTDLARDMQEKLYAETGITTETILGLTLVKDF